MASRRSKKLVPTRYRYQFLVPNGYGRRGNIEFESEAARKIGATHVRHLLKQLQDALPVQPVTQAWLKALTADQHTKLSDAGVVQPRQAPANEVRTLEALQTRFLKTAKGGKAATLAKLNQVCDAMLRYPGFTAETPIASITKGDAREFVAWLKNNGNIRDKERTDLGINTVRRRTGIAKQLFDFAIECKWIDENPFNGLACTVNANEERMQFIDHATINAVIAMAPDARWRAIIALARFGGLRTPSELTGLLWQHVDFVAGRILVHSPKTEHHKGKATRYVPLFPELRPYLEDLRAADLPPNAPVIDGVTSATNLRKGLQSFIKKAGVDVWPKLFQNLRASRETELLAVYPAKDVCGWIGNSQAVAMKHYAMMHDSVFDSASRNGASIGAKFGAQNGAVGEIGALNGAVSESRENSAELDSTNDSRGFDDASEVLLSSENAKKWAVRDSNPRPSRCKRDALTN